MRNNRKRKKNDSDLSVRNSLKRSKLRLKKKWTDNRPKKRQLNNLKNKKVMPRTKTRKRRRLAMIILSIKSFMTKRASKKLSKPRMKTFSRTLCSTAKR